MVVTFALLLAAAGIIYFSCETFVNGVEWLGRKLNLTQTATGTILAAFGTALPESVVTLVAVAFGTTPAHKEIGVGAAIGGPLALSTVAYSVVGFALLAVARRAGRDAKAGVDANTAQLRRDQLWFLAIFVAKIGLGLVVFQFKPLLGIAFLAAYAFYCWRELTADGDGAAHDELEPLMLRPRSDDPALGWVILQTLGALVVIFAASHLFVGQIGAVGPWLGLSPQLTALLFSPIATELPEIMNAVIWVRQRKERLALANISGAMMIQATIPTAFGLFFTPWHLASPSILAAVMTAIAIVFLQFVFRAPRVSSGLLACVGGLYAVFAALLFVI
ncbi:sodium:calcium antiporter [Burkholderia glumae]|uniref:Sodium:calcium antiporter n=1 Tax=Burkholderia glumae TaxID=337 RepID=A0AAP9XVM3_BURGL|nr:sodium:calcium antiporter [Burkholderia glumae]AJY64649.1 sodium/calcium exchanger family protein [Burkholderia glumae LMG 2196 = ATCC 33617]KHJ63042.1 membrane protein [Burkholderia glumae]MCM2484631.1 sodium:calcium antiporter [Burkholderia glumae]MCM2495012.1 sodium:calcium antiporter [Burkholderia glumae]MCM2510324.1 sodium:calcium antiporter [Burkholderia glumae]